MGYDIYIGNAEISYDTDEGEIRIDVAVRDEPEAPYSEGDDYARTTNHRAPSYTNWGDFARRVGLAGFFFDQEVGLMREHPGAFPITAQHVNQVAIARETLLGYAPHATARCKASDLFPSNCDLVRLIWLEWWMRWALDNCQYPTIQNT